MSASCAGSLRSMPQNRPSLPQKRPNAPPNRYQLLAYRPQRWCPSTTGSRHALTKRAAPVGNAARFSSHQRSPARCNPTARLAGFLQTARADLDFIIRNGEIFLLPATTSLALSVWPQIQDRFQRLRVELLEAPAEVDEQLRAVGLADRELDIKLAAYTN